MEAVCDLDGCARPSQVGSVICAVHRVQLEDALTGFPDLADELETTSTRQSRIGAGSGTAAGSLPFASDASDLSRVLPEALDSWAVRLNHWIGTPWAHHAPGSGLEAACRFLLDRMPAVLSLPDLPELCGKLLALHEACTVAIDRPPDRSYVGRCDLCGEPVYAWPGRVSAHCRCGWSVEDVLQRRAELLEAARDAALPAVDVSRACTTLGAPVTPAAIRQWKTRGKLEPAATDLQGRPLYRVGDVLDLIA